MSNLSLIDLSSPSTSLQYEKRINTINVRIQSLGEIRYSTYQSEEHIIIPVVSQVGDSIVAAVNGPGPEFIPGSVLSLYPEQRNGRPIVMGHPQINNEYVFANSSTEVLESYCYGIWMNNYYDEDNKRIKGELWLSKSKAEKLPSDLSPYALDVIDRVSNGKTIEVSEGNWVISEKIDGTYNGQSYVGIWRLALTDHIATLKSNEKGACGVSSHGCGAGPYVMQNSKDDRKSNDITNYIGGSRMSSNKIVNNIRSFVRSLSLKDEKPISNLRTEAYLFDIWSNLNTALQKVEPGFSYIDDIEVDNKLVIYAVSTIEGDRYYTPSEITLYERSYTIDENNKVTLGTERSEVVYVKSYVRVSSKESSGDKSSNKEETNNVDNNRSTNMANDVNTNTVKNCTCGANNHKPTFENSTVADVNANATNAAAPAVVTNVTPTTEPISNVNDLLNLASPELKAQLTGLVNSQRAEKSNLITSLLKIQQEFSKEDLDQMDLIMVRRLAKVSGVVTVEGNNTNTSNYDFSSSRSVNDPNAGKRTQAIALPDPWGLDKKAQG